MNIKSNQPKTVKYAFILMRLLLLTIFISGILAVIYSEGQRAASSLNVGNGVYICLLLAAMAILWTLVVMVNQGVNSARVIFTVFYIVSFIAWIYSLNQPSLINHTVHHIMKLIELLLGLAALILLYRPSSTHWFSDKPKDN